MKLRSNMITPIVRNLDFSGRETFIELKLMEQVSENDRLESEF